MGVREDNDGKYVTSDRPFQQYDHKWQADNADQWSQHCRDSSSSTPQAQNHWQAQEYSAPSSAASSEPILPFIVSPILVWVILFALILIPGLNSAGLLIHAGGFYAIPGGIIFFVLRIVYSILTAPIMIMPFIDPYSGSTPWILQLIMMAVISVIVFIFRRKMKKPILYLTAFLAVLAYSAVGLVAIQDDLWAMFKMFPYLN